MVTSIGEVTFCVKSEEEYKKYLELFQQIRIIEAFDRKWLVREINWARGADLKLAKAGVVLCEVIGE